MNEITINSAEEILAKATEALKAAEAAQAAAELSAFTTNNLWILIAASFVFIMHLGFSTLEAGFVQKKNVVNILFKNSMIIAIGLLTYWFVGFNLMYPGTNAGGYFSFGGFFLNPPEGGMTAAYADYTYWSDFIFQAMFAATGATIVSGAVAGRIKLNAFLIFATLFVAMIYPVTGFWKWGKGWLDALGFYDFAGSTLVHSVGGWAALAGIILLGPRKGKYTSKGIKPIPGHSMPLAALGVFLLWFGWFGFNGGSVLSANPELVSLVFTTTSLSAAGGAIGAFIVSYIMFRSHDLPMVLNGILGGLVGITASADSVSVNSAIIIGLIAGILIPLSVSFFDRIKLDDPVGATSVHLVCGIWGTLAVALFGTFDEGVGELTDQLIGILACGIFAFALSFLLFYLLKITIGIRVSETEEEKGLDIEEHKISAYS
ncbi:MAG: Amt family ammonium transporter [Polaribacter sp.]|jgi:Amt family ammonium transporter